jgi:hypothetical protein
MLMLVAASLGLALVALTATTSKVERASAYSSGHFCGYVIGAGARCVDPVRKDQRYIQATIWGSFGSGDFCVGAKQYSDGSGSNTTPFGCIYTSQGNYTFTGPYTSSIYPNGYSTIINRTGAADAFDGYQQWYP